MIFLLYSRRFYSKASTSNRFSLAALRKRKETETLLAEIPDDPHQSEDKIDPHISNANVSEDDCSDMDDLDVIIIQKTTITFLM